MSADAFKWSADNSDIVLRAYGSVAVHANSFGDVVVRQERDALESDDNYIVLPIQDAELVAQAIIDKVSKIRTAAAADRPPHKPKPAALALVAPCERAP